MSNKILVLTPDPLFVRALSSRLEGDNCTVNTIEKVSDTRLALETVKNWLPNLVIIDDALPGKQHLKICRRLQNCDASIVILGTNMERRAMTEAYQAGASYYILKQGQDLRALVLTVQTALRLQPKSLERLPGLAYQERHNN